MRLDLLSLKSLTLLENHDQNGNTHPLEKRLVGQETGVLVEPKLDVVHYTSALELWEICNGGLPFEHVLCLDFQEFNLDSLVLRRPSTETSQDTQRLFISTLGHEPTWTEIVSLPENEVLGVRLPFWEEHDTHTQYHCWKNLDADGNQPRSIGLALTGSADEVSSVTCSRSAQIIFKSLESFLTDPVRNHDTETNCQLLK